MWVLDQQKAQQLSRGRLQPAYAQLEYNCGVFMEKKSVLLLAEISKLPSKTGKLYRVKKVIFII